MAQNPMHAIAQSIVDAVAPLRDEFESKAQTLRENDAKSQTQTVKSADLAAALEKSEDANVVALRENISEQQKALAEIQKNIREARKAAQEILFPGTTATDVMEDDERKALISEAAAIRKQIVETYKSAQAVAPDFTLPDLSPVVGQRGRQAGFTSASAGKPKPRVSAISLDGKPLDKATFGNLQKQIKATTGVAVENDILVDAFFDALGTKDWQSDAVKGKTVEFTKVVNTETGREISVSVTV